MHTKIDLGALHLTDARRDLLLLAQTAQAAGRHDDMWQFMQALADAVQEGELTTEERTLLDAAYRNVTRGRRAALSAIRASGSGNASLLPEYEKQVAAELLKLWEDAVTLLTNKGLPLSPSELRELEQELSAYREGHGSAHLAVPPRG